MGHLIVQGRIVNHNSSYYGQVKINTRIGLITGVGKRFGSADIITEGMIFPGFGDIHVHAKQDESEKWDYKETFHTASLAAINGGVTFFVAQPNDPIAPTTDERYMVKRRLTEKSLVPVILYAGIGPGTMPLSFDVPYKAFMGPSVGDLFFKTQEQLEQTIRNYRGKNVSFHCEDPEVLRQNEGQKTHELRRPNEAEVVAIEFALELIRKYDLIGNICHCSTIEGLMKVIEARRKGLNVTVEVTPHNLFFDDSMITAENSLWLRVNPPIRSAKDRKALLEGLKNGCFDYFATDHAPHTMEEKLKGTSGLPHLDTYGAFITWLMKECGIIPNEIARICSYNPGRFVKPFLSERYGKGFGVVEEGYAGSLTIVNPLIPTLVSEERLKTKCGWSPFKGVVFPGSVSYTVVMGEPHLVNADR